MDAERVLADTSLFIEHLRSRDKSSTRLYRETSRRQVETSAIVAAEIYYGARTSDAELQARSALAPFIIHAFTPEMAARQGEIVRELVRQNRLQDMRDVMIAACALELGLPVAKLNRSHFESVPGLALIEF